ncbi:hypothetical protein BD626DRAFT_503619 [Schizophyllum amplum]|uniref:Uncharacterized protein n=1 Tax=Schizophyllum amplum TaxID=97359 RepID=A0A550C7E2_9AGAR|nr:hypothetical protein BD626DRAFT_503619 [Auriculariopsis ampla]
MFGSDLGRLQPAISETIAAAEWDLNVTGTPGGGFDVEVGNLLAGATRRRPRQTAPRPRNPATQPRTLRETAASSSTPRRAPQEDADDSDSMPELQSVSNSSESEDDGTDSESGDDEEVSRGGHDAPRTSERFPSPWGQVASGRSSESSDYATAPSSAASGSPPTSRFSTSVARSHGGGQRHARQADSDSEDDMPPLEPVDAMAALESDDSMPPLEPISGRSTSTSGQAAPSRASASSPPLPTEFVTNGQGGIVYSGSESSQARSYIGRM